MDHNEPFIDGVPNPRPPMANYYPGDMTKEEFQSWLSRLPEAVREFVLQNGVSADGHFMKYLGNNEVDSSLLWIAVPYRLVEPTDPRFLATVAKI